MSYVFLDESGQFTKHNHEEYFVVASFTVGDPRRTEKSFRSWCRTRFPKKMRGQSEIKWSSTHINEDLRLRTLKYISNLDIRIRYSFLLRKNIPSEYNHKGKIKSGLLYASVIGETLEMYLPIEEKEFRVFCDKRHLKNITEADFKKMLASHMLPNLSKGAVFQIEMKDSTSDANIQIADWVVGALAWYLEKKPLGESCFTILKNNLLGEGKELFKNS